MNRQHPRDLFDFDRMENKDFSKIRCGLLFNLASSDKPIIESLFPNPINQTDALERQFAGMSEQEYSYEDYLLTRNRLQEFVQEGLTYDDKQFLLSIEQGEPNWELCFDGNWSVFPSIIWKQQNIHKLQRLNPSKYERIISKFKEKMGL